MTDPQSAADLARRIVATAGDAIIAADAMVGSSCEPRGRDDVRLPSGRGHR